MKKKLAFFFCWFLSELIFRLILDDLPRTKSKALSSLLKSAVEAAADFQLNIYVWGCCCLSYYYSIPSRISISKKRDRWSSFDPALCQSFFSHGSTGSQYGNTMVFSQEEQLLARSFVRSSNVKSSSMPLRHLYFHYTKSFESTTSTRSSYFYPLCNRSSLW